MMCILWNINDKTEAFNQVIYRYNFRLPVHLKIYNRFLLSFHFNTNSMASFQGYGYYAGFK